MYTIDMSIFNEILRFAIPCWVINMSLNGIFVASIYFPKLTAFDKPLDAGKFWNGRRILGNARTWYGLPVSVTAGFLIHLIISHNFKHALLIGILNGLTVYVGDILGSFIKRRLNFRDGQFLPLVDHGDYVIITGIVFGLLQIFPWKVIGLALLITYLVHPIVTYLAFLGKWRNDPL